MTPTMDDVNRHIVNAQVALASMWTQRGKSDAYDRLRDLLSDAEYESRKLIGQEG